MTPSIDNRARVREELQTWWNQHWPEFARDGMEQEYQNSTPDISRPDGLGLREFWFVHDDGSLGEWDPEGLIHYYDQGAPRSYVLQDDGSWKLAVDDTEA